MAPLGASRDADGGLEVVPAQMKPPENQNTGPEKRAATNRRRNNG